MIRDADITPSVDVAVLCPRAHWAEALARELRDAQRENWAPFRAWRGKIGATQSDSASGSTPFEAEIFILVSGEGQRAALAGALQLMTTCPGAPIVQWAPFTICDPAIKPGDRVVIEKARGFQKEALYVLERRRRTDGADGAEENCGAEDVEAPRIDTLAGAPLMAALERSDQWRRVVCASSAARVDFDSQRRWLHERLGARVYDEVSRAVGALVAEQGADWIALGVALTPDRTISPGVLRSASSSVIGALAQITRHDKARK